MAFRDSSSFRAGELHRHIDQWDKLFQSSDNNFSEVLDWIHNFIHVDKFFTHYKGSYKGVNYNCDRPPARIFANHPSCKAFAQFISDTLIETDPCCFPSMGYYSLGALALLAEPGHHLSYPRGSSFNDGISSDYTTVSYATVENAIGLIKSVGPNCFLAKTDVKNAFRLVPIRPEDYDLLGIYWQLAIVPLRF